MNCSRCDFLTNSRVWIGKHVELVHMSGRKELEFNCNQCDFQGTSKEQLNKHNYFKHTIEDRMQGNKFVCNNCGEKKE